MHHTSRKVRLSLVLIAAWSIVQTLFHLFWVIYGYLMIICHIKPTYYDVVFVYLTYFYRQSCGALDVKRDTLFIDRTDHEDIDFANDTTSNIVYRFINATLNKADLPSQSRLLPRTEMYLVLLFITDAVWIGTSVLLLIGAFTKVKQKYLSVIFYGPWLLCSIFVNFVDVVSSVQYGIDLISIKSYTSWLEFIGVTNYNDFKVYNEHPSSLVIPAMPTTVMIALLGRLFIVWLTNIVSFFAILFLAIPELFWKATVPPRVSSQGKLRLSTGDDLELNSSAARIRAWQLFYGAVEANSTMASTSNPDENGKDRETMGNNIEEWTNIENSVPQPNTALAFLDTNNRNITVLKGHMPWSYINPEGNYVRPAMGKPSQINEENDDDSATYCTKL